jgi:hypothetical protein
MGRPRKNPPSSAADVDDTFFIAYDKKLRRSIFAEFGVYYRSQ